MFSNAAYRVKLNSFSAGVIINYRLTTLYNNTDTDLYSIHWHLNTNKFNLCRETTLILLNNKWPAKLGVVDVGKGR